MIIRLIFNWNFIVYVGFLNNWKKVFADNFIIKQIRQNMMKHFSFYFDLAYGTVKPRLFIQFDAHRFGWIIELDEYWNIKILEKHFYKKNKSLIPLIVGRA